MAEKTTLILVTLLFFTGGLLFAGFGFLVGSSQKTNPLQSLYNSGVVQTVNAFATGTITTIEEQNITLKNNQKTMTIPVRQHAQVALILPPPNPANPPLIPERELLSFEDLMVGDRINLFTEITPEGSLEGVSVDVIIKASRSQ
jgi:hypothetical protein